MTHHSTIRPEIVERVMARRGRLHIFDRLEPARTAVVVIDMQNTFCQPGAPAEVPKSRDIVEPINRLNAAVRQAGGHVIWVTHANMNAGNGQSDWRMFFENFTADDVRQRTIESLEPGGEGQQVWHELDVAEEDLKIFKNRYSALIPGSSNLERILRSLGVTNLLIVGTKTNVCCESTARDAMMMDFNVVIVADGCAALSDQEHEATLSTVIQQFGDVFTVDEVTAILR